MAVSASEITPRKSVDLAKARERVRQADLIAVECAESLPNKDVLNGLDRWQRQIECMLNRYHKPYTTAAPISETAVEHTT